MAKYLFLIQHKPDAYAGLSPETMQDILRRYGHWVQQLKDSGAYLASEGLANDGRTLRKEQDRLRVSDGPYVESKELVAGFYLVEARDYEHAVELARDCPVLERGILEIRQIVAR
ncbi:MAG TPA: YciI family protein [Haliangiales bacterium]|nr:YciI family protein [Haliangiales bacterium]